jgi:hypothetical protein
MSLAAGSLCAQPSLLRSRHGRAVAHPPAWRLSAPRCAPAGAAADGQGTSTSGAGQMDAEGRGLGRMVQAAGVAAVVYTLVAGVQPAAAHEIAWRPRRHHRRMDERFGNDWAEEVVAVRGRWLGAVAAPGGPPSGERHRPSDPSRACGPSSQAELTDAEIRLLRMREEEQTTRVADEVTWATVRAMQRSGTVRRRLRGLLGS